MPSTPNALTLAFSTPANLSPPPNPPPHTHPSAFSKVPPSRTLPASLLPTIPFPSPSSPNSAMHDIQADLMSCIKQILFPAALKSIFGAAFLDSHGSEHLQKAFFAFEEGFELAASPVPHFLQPSFCRGRRALLEAFRWAVCFDEVRGGGGQQLA